MPIPIRSPAEIDAIARVGQAVWRTIDAAIEVCSPGVTTLFLDEVASIAARAFDAEPLFAGYTQNGAPPFPGRICVSVNEEVVHGVPGERDVREGDLVTVDVGLRLGGWCADAARSVVVAFEPPDAARLLAAARAVLDATAGAIGPGRRWSDVARAASVAAEAAGVVLVRGFTGHGIGRSLHESPRLPLGDEIRPGEDFTLRPGMVLAIEPVVAERDAGTKVLEDGWTVVMRDRSLACHEELTVAVTRSGARVLTAGPDGGFQAGGR